jgi:hypothetical protein
VLIYISTNFLAPIPCILVGINDFIFQFAPKSMNFSRSIPNRLKLVCIPEIAGPSQNFRTRKVPNRLKPALRPAKAGPSAAKADPAHPLVNAFASRPQLAHALHPAQHLARLAPARHCHGRLPLAHAPPPSARQAMPPLPSSTPLPVPGAATPAALNSASGRSAHQPHPPGPACSPDPPRRLLQSRPAPQAAGRQILLPPGHQPPPTAQHRPSSLPSLRPRPQLIRITPAILEFCPDLSQRVYPDK